MQGLVRYFASKDENGSTHGLAAIWKGASGCNGEAVRFCLSSNGALVNNFLNWWNKL